MIDIRERIAQAILHKINAPRYTIGQTYDEGYDEGLRAAARIALLVTDDLPPDQPGRTSDNR